MGKKPFGRAARSAPAEPAAVPPVVRQSFSDLRRSRRTRTVLGGALFFGGAGFTVDCTISDISETGARVRVDAGLTVPRDVILVHLRDYIAYEAKVAWRRDNGLLGLQFKSTRDLRGEPANELTAAMRTYCVEHDLRASMPKN